MTKWLKYTIPTALLVFAAVAVAAPVLLPRPITSTDRVPVVNTGTTTAYTVSPEQIKAYVFNNNTSAPGVYTFNGRDGAVAPQAGDYTAAQVGADPSGTAAAAVATHNAAYNHLNIPTNQQIGAMTGTSGTPSTTNAFVTNADPRNSNARTPTAHASSHTANGSDPLTLATSQVQGLDTALAGKQAALSNAATLGKITEAGNLPMWNGGAWPGGGDGGGDMYKATYDPQAKNADAFNRANHTGTQPADSITGLAASATTDTTTTANITSSTNKRFVTDAQQSVLINTSGTNSGDVTLGGTANGLLLTGQQLSLQLATNAQSGALSAADHTSYAQGASLAATALQPSSTLDASKLSGTATVNTTGTASNVTGTVAIANGGTGATTAAAARTALGAVPTTTTVNGHALSTNVSVTAADVGLGSVNNTSDAAKPISTATQAALDLKSPIDNPTITTGVTAPVFTSNASDGTHYIKPYNSTAYSGTCTKGMVQTVGTPAALQVCTADGTWAAAGTGGSGSGTVNNSSNAYHIAGYAATGTTVSDTGITYSADGTTITTAQGTAPDALTLRPGSANGTSGVTLLGPSGATTAYSLQFPTAAPTAGQIPVFGTPSGATVPVTWGANGGGGGGGTWGSITGTLANQTDLNTALGLKAPLTSPSFSGTPTAPTPAAGVNNLQIATTAFVANAVASAGGGTGTIGGSTGSTDNAVLVASGTGGATLKAALVTIAPDGSTISTAKIASTADAHLLRAAPDMTGAGFMGPATGTTTPYYIQLPATPPDAGQALTFGASSTGTVNGTTANIIPLQGPAADGTHRVNVRNTVARSYTPTEGDMDTDSAGKLWLYTSGQWVEKASGTTYTLPTASASTLGGVKVGTGLAIDGSGILSATGGGGGSGLTVVAPFSGTQTIAVNNRYTTTATSRLTFSGHAAGTTTILAKADTTLVPDASSGVFSWLNPITRASTSTTAGYSALLKAGTYADIMSNGDGTFQINANANPQATGTNEYAGGGSSTFYWSMNSTTIDSPAGYTAVAGSPATLQSGGPSGNYMDAGGAYHNGVYTIANAASLLNKATAGRVKISFYVTNNLPKRLFMTTGDQYAFTAYVDTGNVLTFQMGDDSSRATASVTSNAWHTAEFYWSGSTMGMILDGGTAVTHAIAGSRGTGTGFILGDASSFYSADKMDEVYFYAN